jgi:type I restriction enzyme S subunit
VAVEHDDLPQEWARATVADVGSVRLGRQRSPDKQSGQFTTKYLRAANITVEGLDLTDVLEMDFTPAERAVLALQAGDIVPAEASGSAAQLVEPRSGAARFQAAATRTRSSAFDRTLLIQALPS